MYTVDVGRPGIDEKQKYVGVVVDDADIKMLQRVKVRVPMVHDGIPDEHLPWAIPDAGEQNNGATSTTGTVDVPLKGSKVCVKFQSGKLSHPMYSAYYTDETTVIEESKHNYPKRKVVRFKDGSILVVDVKDNVVYMRAAGNVKAYVEGNVELHVHGNVDEVVDGNIRRIVKGSVDEVIMGSVRRHVGGSVDEVVVGNDSKTVSGDLNESISGSSHRHSSGKASISTDSSAVIYGSSSATLEAGGTVFVEGAVAQIQQHGGSKNPGAARTASEANKAVLTDWPGFPGGERGK